MQAIYIDSSVPEKTAKNRFCFPEFIMMENAAVALETEVRSALKNISFSEKPEAVLILCGTGNNGGDGYALARRLCGFLPVKIFSVGEPKTQEAAGQKLMAVSCGVEVTESVEEVLSELKNFSGIIVDCLYGTGFHGSLNESAENLLTGANESSAYKIACDVPSGIDRNGQLADCSNGKKIAFCADLTVTMGALKAALFSDAAKNFCGKIVTADLGITSEKFCECAEPDAFLLERNDIKLPVRTKKSAHKGDFGHAAVTMGEKAGAGVIAGTAALSFGAGLVTEVDSGLCKANFMMSPELMVSDSLPERTSAVLLGSGLGRSEKSFAVAENVIKKVFEMKNPSVVLDADFFYYEKLKEVLERLNSIPGARVILTPHPKELHELLLRTSVVCFALFESTRSTTGMNYAVNEPNTAVIEPVETTDATTEICSSVPEALEGSKSLKDMGSELCCTEGRASRGEITFADVCDRRFEYARLFAKKYSNLVLVCKGANTYICAGENSFVCDCGSVALAKAGSGDVLAGLCTALLAQGYSAEDAAKTAVYAHAEASCNFERNYECTPLGLAERLGRMQGEEMKSWNA